MDEDQRISFLKEKHKEIHDICEANPTPELKKQKLALKDEINKLEVKKNYLYDEHAGGLDGF